MNKTLTILIPSRNRLEILLRVLHFIEMIRIKDVYLNVVISDNSDIPYPKIESSLHLQILRPPICLPMPLHWEWLINEVESDYFCVLTDRSLLIPQNFAQAFTILNSTNADLISYSFAGYSDHYFPYFIGGLGYTNESYFLSCSSIMEDARKSHYWSAFPRALNCIFTSRVIVAFKRKYGCTFGGFSPDINFAFKYLSVFDDFIYFDKPVFLSTAINLSNGRDCLKGNTTELQTWVLSESQKRLNNNEPLPSIADVPSAINYITHEMADVQGLDGLLWDSYYERIEKEKITRKKLHYISKKLYRPFTFVKSYKLAMMLSLICFNTSHLVKKYIFE